MEGCCILYIVFFVVVGQVFFFLKFRNLLMDHAHEKKVIDMHKPSEYKIKENHKTPRRIVLTGGPGGGKTTACDILRRELGKHVAFVPEAATMLFMGGFPRYENPHCVEYQQRAIYAVQVNLEQTQRMQYPGRILLCDRGTLDGAAYWEGGMQDWCERMGTTEEKARHKKRREREKRREEEKRRDIMITLTCSLVGNVSLRCDYFLRICGSDRPGHQRHHARRR